MKKLGTHNSLSYLPCQWYLRPFSWVGKCQSKTIEEQYKCGVRYFDIRIKFDKHGNVISGHGLLTYQVDVIGILEWLNIQKDKIIVRLFLENSKKNPREKDELFKKFIDFCMTTFLNIRFIEGGCRHAYQSLISDNIDNIRICYAEYWKMKFCIPFPYLWAKKHNKTNHESDNNKDYSIYDFI